MVEPNDLCQWKETQFKKLAWEIISKNATHKKYYLTKKWHANSKCVHLLTTWIYFSNYFEKILPFRNQMIINWKTQALSEFNGFKIVGLYFKYLLKLNQYKCTVTCKHTWFIFIFVCIHIWINIGRGICILEQLRSKYELLKLNIASVYTF